MDPSKIWKYNAFYYHLKFFNNDILFSSTERGLKTLYDALLDKSLWSDQRKVTALRDVLSRGDFYDGCSDLKHKPLRDVRFLLKFV